jgi:hypothetical protein
MNLQRKRARAGARMFEVAAALALAGACTPDVGSNPVPTAMQFDLAATPPRAPQPTFLVVDPATGHINFAQANIDIPDDCATQTALSQADCQFDQWLQTLNGFPTVTPASAPASGPLDPASLTLGPGANVVAVAAKAGAPATDLATSFDAASVSLTVTPPNLWTLGEFYWIGVRGYQGGVLDAAGHDVVGSPTMALLKQDTSLTCDAASPADIDPHCPAFEVLAQGAPDATAAAGQLFQLEQIRTAYIGNHGFDAMAAAGLPKEEIAVLWGFPIHTNSVPVLVPNTAAVPHVPAADQIVVGVQGPVDPTTVSAFVVEQQNGPVVVMDLTAAAAGDLNAGFPTVHAQYVPPPAVPGGAIAIKADAPFPAGHLIGLFFTNAIKSPDGAPLVASPVSVLLRLTAPLVDSGGHSTVSGFSDADAAALEAGRQGLAQVLDNPIFAPLTGVTRANIVYAYAFVPMVTP